MNLQDTIGNAEWLQQHEDAIKDMLPETWTHINNLNGLQLGFKLKLLGIDWRNDDEFGKIMLYLEKVKIMLRDGFAVRRNPHSIFK